MSRRPIDTGASETRTGDLSFLQWIPIFWYTEASRVLRNKTYCLGITESV